MVRQLRAEATRAAALRAAADLFLDVGHANATLSQVSAQSGVTKGALYFHFASKEELARAIVEAVPDRVIWGSDWPHIPEGGRDTGELLNLLGDWIPEAAARDRILRDNPARLFGYEAR